MMPVMASAAFVVSVIALLVAVASAWFARRQAVASEKLTQIERDRRDDEISSARAARVAEGAADVQVSLDRTFGLNSQLRLSVRNKGPATATGVHVAYLDVGDGRPAPSTKRWCGLDGDYQPREERHVSPGLTGQIPRSFQVILTWSDGRGEQSEEVTLTAR